MVVESAGGRGGVHAGVHTGFVSWLDSRRLSGRTRGNYAERADKYLRWLSTYAPQADPLGSVSGRDWAVRDYRTWLLTVAKSTPATVATTLTALQAFYDHLGLPGRIDVDPPHPATPRTPSVGRPGPAAAATRRPGVWVGAGSGGAAGPLRHRDPGGGVG